MDKDKGSIPGGDKVLYINNYIKSAIPDEEGGWYIGENLQRLTILSATIWPV